MRVVALLFLFVAFVWAGNPDSLTVRSINQESRTFFNSATGVWWPAQPKSSRASFPHHAAKSGVVVWFHGGMTSGNCEKGLVAGGDFAKLFPEVIVVSASACRETHWVTGAMVAAVDAALDSVAQRRGRFVDEVSLVGVSDGALGVLYYSMQGKRRVKDRLLMSSFGKLLGGAPVVAGAGPRMRDGRWRFLQGGNDRLFPAGEAAPWIEEFCRSVQADCMLRFDPAGEHDWSYWREKHLDWIRESISSGK